MFNLTANAVASPAFPAELTRAHPSYNDKNDEHLTFLRTIL
jgi:hypothetical protein